MGLSNIVCRHEHVGDGATATYAFSFPIVATSDLKVIVQTTAGVEHVLSLGTHYSVSYVTGAASGTITIISGLFAWITSGFLTDDYKLTIRRVRPLTQTADIRNQGTYYPETHEDKFDQLVMLHQQQQDDIDRSIKAPESDTDTMDPLPSVALRASKFLAFDADGQPIASAGGIDGSVTVSSFGESLVDDATASDALTTLGVTAYAKNLLADATASDALDTLGVTAFAKTVLDDTTAGAALTTLGVSAFAQTVLDDTTAAAARTTLGATGASGTWKAAQLDDEILYNKNWVHNGNFDLWERGTSFASVSHATTYADRWRYEKVTSGAAHTIARDTEVPTLAESGFQSSYSILVDCTTADAVVDAADLVRVGQNFTGYDWAELIGKEVTLSFWVKATKTGIHCVSFQNNGQNRSYVAEYTINTTETWEKKTVTVTLNPSGGTEDYTTGVGLRVFWTLLAGSNNQTSANTWFSGARSATASQVNACDSTSNNFRLAQVKLNVGGTAQKFNRAGGSIQGEEDLCAAFYQKSYSKGVTPGTATEEGQAIARAYGTNAIAFGPRFHRPMHVAPTTITIYSPSAGTAAKMDRVGTGAVDASAASSVGTSGFSTTSSGSVTSGDLYSMQWSAIVANF